MAPLEANRDVLSKKEMLGTSRVEPRELNSRPVFGRVFVLRKVGRTPAVPTAGAVLPIRLT